MAYRLGWVLYWACLGLAVLFVLVWVFRFFTDPAALRPHESVGRGRPLFIHETDAFTLGKKASIAIAIMLAILGPYMNLPIVFYVALTLMFMQSGLRDRSRVISHSNKMRRFPPTYH